MTGKTVIRITYTYVLYLRVHEILTILALIHTIFFFFHLLFKTERTGIYKKILPSFCYGCEIFIFYYLSEMSVCCSKYMALQPIRQYSSVTAVRIRVPTLLYYT